MKKKNPWLLIGAIILISTIIIDVMMHMGDQHWAHSSGSTVLKTLSFTLLVIIGWGSVKAFKKEKE
ncbi:MAG: hypothetical protein KGO81_14210 [Bacteroidota bacterium]|nr:hypothetical protein [Bacteroidota bacterium]